MASYSEPENVLLREKDTRYVGPAEGHGSKRGKGARKSDLRNFAKKSVDHPTILTCKGEGKTSRNNK